MGHCTQECNNTYMCCNDVRPSPKRPTRMAIPSFLTKWPSAIADNSTLGTSCPTGSSQFLMALPSHPTRLEAWEGPFCKPAYQQHQHQCQPTHSIQIVRPQPAPPILCSAQPHQPTLVKNSATDSALLPLETADEATAKLTTPMSSANS